MAEELRLTISSPNNNDYDICLSKFFCMTFFDKRKKQLDVFFATVFGGYRKETEGYKDSKPCSYDSDNAAMLKFVFSDSKTITDFRSEDLTNVFLEQKEEFKNFWGNTKEYSDQNNLYTEFAKIYGKDASGPKKLPTDKGFYYIGQDKKRVLNPCFVTAGKFVNTSHGKEKSFTLQTEINTKSVSYDGIQFINWTKCTINLSSSIIEKQIVFWIELKDIANTPDFTWYFAPPVDYEIRNPELRCRINDEPLSDWELNRVMPVSDRTTVLFGEWVAMQIGDRIKSRVVLDKKINIKEIGVEIKIKEASGLAATRQFFVGLIIAFLLSYFADQTRVNDFTNCFCNNLIILRTIIPMLLAIMIGLCAVSWLCRSKRAESADEHGQKEKNNRKFQRLFQITGFVSTGLVVLLYILIPLFTTHMNTKVSIIVSIVFMTSLVISVVSQIVDLFHYKKLHERPLRDIL